MRLDLFLAKLSKESRSQVQNAIEKNLVKVNGKIINKASFKVKGNEKIEYSFPKPEIFQPENIPLDILYEDKYLIAINKPYNMVTHPSVGNYSGTLVNALSYIFTLPEQEDFNKNGILRPGIVHRLDKDTSGVIIVAKTIKSHAYLSEAFQNRQVKKTYVAIAKGNSMQDITVNAAIGRHLVQRQKMCINGINAKEAITSFKIITSFENYFFVECKPLTGRTHQIRVHLEYLNCPIIGDIVYGKSSELIARQALHAQKIAFRHPEGHFLEIKAPVSFDILQAWQKITLEEDLLMG